MNIKEKWIKFRENIARKRLIKNMTPALLNEMVNDLAGDVEQVLAMEDANEREVAISEVLEGIADVGGIIDEVMENVDKQIEDLSKSNFWMTQELVSSDLRGLKRGRDSLIQKKNELEQLKSKLTGDPAKENVDESEIKYE